MRNFNESKMGSNIVKNREKLYAYYSKKQSHNVRKTVLKRFRVLKTVFETEIDAGVNFRIRF